MSWLRIHRGAWGLAALFALAVASAADAPRVDESLFWAAFAGNTARVKELVATGVDVNARDSDGATGLMLASGNGHKEVAQALLAAKADVNLKNANGSTALLMALAGGHGELAGLLVEAGAALDARTNDGATALMGAAHAGHVPWTRYLLERGADVGAATSHGLTALMFAAGAAGPARDPAAQEGRLAVLRMLLEAGADANARNSQGWTALSVASARGQSQVVDLLRNWVPGATPAADVGRRPKEPAPPVAPPAPTVPAPTVPAHAVPAPAVPAAAVPAPTVPAPAVPAAAVPAPAVQQLPPASQLPVTCQAPQARNLTENEAKALRYVLERKLGFTGVACITELVAVDKFPLRGQTVVLYEMTITFPNGYRAECLDKKSFEVGGFSSHHYGPDCPALPIPPVRPGEVWTYRGDEII